MAGVWLSDGTFKKFDEPIVNNNLDNSYNAIVDQVSQNNSFSAEQASKQMDFQRDLFEKANKFSHDEAELNRAFQQESADKAMQFSSAEAEANRQWQEIMSNTAHQREMADLKAAGLNPILASNNGSAVGAGATANSAQAAGYGVSSVGAPPGAKADADRSGTMAIANLLGKMLDNQTEIQKMIVSAETARETAEMYTGATRYAAELNRIATQYMADQSYNASYNNPYNVLGHELGEFINSLKGYGVTAENGLNFVAKNGIQDVADTLMDKAKSGLSKVYNYVTKEPSSKRSHKFGKF